MLNQTDLSTLKKGDQVLHFLLIRKCEIRLTKNGKEYLALELGDKSCTLNSNMWEKFEPLYNALKPGGVVKLQGEIEDYQGVPQIKITRIRPAVPEDGINIKDFLPRSKNNPAVMLSEFMDRIERISAPELKQLMLNIFTGRSLELFSEAPAGKQWHHSYIHGLIEHTLEIIKICDLMCNIHPEVNRDLLICGAMLHDFGKIEELKFDGAFEYSDKGKLIGHIVISAMLINEEAAKIPGFPEDVKNCLMHLVLSHQGKLEYASPVVPKTLEAIILYQADELSAKTNAYKNAIASAAKSESKWTRYIGLAATDLYNHGITPAEEESINKQLFE